jgi:heme/copper-type cytochrome/quinol oxidase subunit 2
MSSWTDQELLAEFAEHRTEAAFAELVRRHLDLVHSAARRLMVASPHSADDVTTVSELVLPVNRPVIVELTAKDVIHSFGVPAMRVKQDAIPGMMTRVWFTPTREGVFEVACSQLCGLGHYRMRAVVRVVSSEEFTRWLTQSR